jgi:hypothetical protein
MSGFDTSGLYEIVTYFETNSENGKLNILRGVKRILLKQLLLYLHKPEKISTFLLSW